MYPRLFQFGHIAIPTYGVFAALALVAALALAMQMARRLSLNTSAIWNFCLLGIFTGLFGSRLLLILFHPRDFFAHPFWMLGLVTIRNTAFVYGGVVVALLGCLVYALAMRLPLRRTLDCLAPPVALGLAIRSMGAFFAGSEYGAPTHKPWGVVYMHALATLWSGTPLFIRLHPVQVYEAVVLFGIFAILVVRVSPRTRPGSVAGGFLMAYGIAEYFLDFFRGNRVFFFEKALTFAQILSVFLLFMGALLLLDPVTRNQKAASLEV